MQYEEVVLVDTEDRPCGSMEKLAAHQQGLLHRAFSIFIFRDESYQELLLQQRAWHKYHTGGLWSNSCCGHPRVAEELLAAAQRRLYEELGISTQLASLGSFIYQVNLSNNLIEHEYDYVLFGIYGKLPRFLNSEEVNELKWMEINSLREDLARNPQNYTPWLPAGLQECMNKLNIGRQ